VSKGSFRIAQFMIEAPEVVVGDGGTGTFFHKTEQLGNGPRSVPFRYEVVRVRIPLVNRVHAFCAVEVCRAGRKMPGRVVFFHTLLSLRI